MRKWTKSTIFLMVIFLFQSCIKDLKDVEDIEVNTWQPEVAIALVNTSVSIQDFIDDFDDDGYLEIDNENFMTLVYESNVFSTSGDEIFAMPDFTIPMLDTSIVAPYDIIDTPFDIDFFTIKSGVLNYSFESPYSEDIEVMIEVRNLTQNGKKLQFSTTADYQGSTPVEVSGSIDLTGHILDFANDVVEVRYVAMNPTNERQYLNNMQLMFQDFEYDFAQGYFSQYSFDLEGDTIAIDLFEDAISGSINVENPIINLTINSSFGIPIEMTANQFEALTIDGGIMSVTTPLNDGIAFNYPTLMEAGQTKTTKITIDNTNSNLSEVIAGGPKELRFDMEALTNPTNDSSIKGFVKDDSQFDVDLEVEIPMWFSASDFAINNISEFDAEFFEDIISAEFKLITENGLPVEAGIQVYFLNDDDVILDSLFNSANENLIAAAEVDATGKVTTPTTGEEIVEVTASQIEKFRNATKISVQGTISTSNDGTTPVKFYTDYGMTFKLGAKAKLKE